MMKEEIEMRKQFVSFLLAFVMVVTLALPSNARANKPGEMFAPDESMQTEDMESLEPHDEVAPIATVAYPQMTGYYLVSVRGYVNDSDGKPVPLKEDCNVAEQKSNLTTAYETKNEFLTSKSVILTFYHEGIGVNGEYIKPGVGYFAVNGPGYNSKVDGNNRVLAYYTDTTISNIDSTITDLTLTSSMKEQRESTSHVQKEWRRTITIHFNNDSE